MLSLRNQLKNFVCFTCFSPNISSIYQIYSYTITETVKAPLHFEFHFKKYSYFYFYCACLRLLFSVLPAKQITKLVWPYNLLEILLLFSAHTYCPSTLILPKQMTSNGFTNCHFVSELKCKVTPDCNWKELICILSQLYTVIKSHSVFYSYFFFTFLTFPDFLWPTWKL